MFNRIQSDKVLHVRSETVAGPVTAKLLYNGKVHVRYRIALVAHRELTHPLSLSDIEGLPPSAPEQG